MNNFLENSITLVGRELDKLANEISLFKSEQNIWVIGKGISNSAGNLTLHLCGNLQHFIGKILGNTNYIRNREEEFSAKGISRDQLLKKIITTKEVVTATLTNLAENELQEEYPLEVLGYKMTKQYFLLHLLGHLNYHLGQINYHRRLLD